MSFPSGPTWWGHIWGIEGTTVNGGDRAGIRTGEEERGSLEWLTPAALVLRSGG